MAFDIEAYGLKAAGPDAVRPFTVDGLDVRGRAVALGPMLNQILDRHAYPAPVARLLGEAIVLTALLGTALKFDGRFTVQTQSDGPVNMLVVDFTAPGSIRAYARYDEQAFRPGGPGEGADPATLLGRGHLAMTIDQGKHMQRYQGLVELDGISLEEVARRYFARSEQIPTEVRLGVGRLFTRRDGQSPSETWTAGGILVQFLPEAPERMRQADLHPGNMPEGTQAHTIDEDDAWMEAKSLVGTVRDDELTDPEITVERLLFRLFHERGVRMFDAQPILDRCRCSREKIEAVLENFSAEERTDMVQDGRIIVTCEFCSTRYEFKAEAV
ncbi:Hsp33 family molecular chaperone [Microvirga tunisiensis]|uniref:Hsp33 family molecular chaperone n=1 Tax=Pannonibacter tanglangensis TaxID=2750084 RepID=A0A7X5F304_9HYPH|nr:Hsp33 family molecular chaperone [Pannonibacter sp. XCT-53]